MSTGFDSHGRVLPPAFPGPMIRTALGVVLLTLLAAGMAMAVPLPPDVLAGLPPADRDLFEAEPFSTDPPTELQGSMRARLADGQALHLRMIVLLVDFSDRPATGEMLDLENLRTRLFSRGVLPKGSMADYYAENSGGRLSLDGTIRGWFRAPKTYGEYVSGQAGLGFYPYNAQGLAEDAVRLADPQVNFATFDDDGPDSVPDTIDDDQIVDLLMIVHTGIGTEASGGRNELRALAWNTTHPIEADGVTALYFGLAPWSGATGVFAHETGHLFGLPDLYDATGRSFGLGLWSLMAGGWSLDNGETPVHLDPWCKYRLGFIDPINVSGSLDNVTIAPVESGGNVYRLARNGSIGLEYFLVENRQPIGYDSFLPGGGLLIYHVDEALPTNNLSPHYLVGLEQADGLYQLENLFGDPSFGDAGDSWTAATPGGGFGRFTVPDSRSYDGNETGVTVFRIQGPDASRRMTASLRALKGAVARLGNIEVVPVTGDGDAHVEAGESFEIRPDILVEGGDVNDVVVTIASTDPQARVEVASSTVGSLSVGTHRGLVVLRGSAGNGLTTNPYPLPYTLTIGFREEVPARTDIIIGAGDQVGLSADFESDFGGFRSRPMRLGVYDLWRQEVDGGSPGRAWHAGLPGSGSLAGADGGLTTPLFLIPPAGRLRLDQLVSIAATDSGDVVAGGFVEISVNGGGWSSITPTRGYDRRYFSSRAEYNGRGIFTGVRPNWEPIEFDLSAYSGSAQVRFRFFSEQTTEDGAGWWIDNVVVDSKETPVRLLSLTAAPGPDGILIAWKLDPDELPVQVHLDRTDPVGVVTRLASRTGAAEDSCLDVDADGAGPVTYRLDAVERDGTLQVLGLIEASPQPPARLRLAADPNPTRGETSLGFALPADGPYTLELFDHAGRPVRRLNDRAGTAGEVRLTWDGRSDRGDRLPAGIYFARLVQRHAVAISRVVIVR